MLAAERTSANRAAKGVASVTVAQNGFIVVRRWVSSLMIIVVDIH
jgi:hypothetical protein